MKVVVVGAGYAGTLAANRAARKVPDAEVVVVSPRPEFVERVRLHERVVGTGAAALPLSDMLRDGVRARLGAVEKVGDGTVTLDDGAQVDFDHLFLAVGSVASPLPGTVPIGTWEGAEEARAALAGLPAGGTVSVVGAGPTGIETAAEIAYGRPDLSVRLVGPRLAATFSTGARRRVRAGLERLGVSVVADTVTEVLGGARDATRAREATRAGDAAGAGERGAHEVRLRSGERFDSDLTLWAVLGGAPELAARSGLEVDGAGRAVVDPYLRSVSDPRISVVGDCAAVPGVRPSCQAAGPQGAHAADTLARTVRGRAPRPFSLGYGGTALSLGRRDAVVQLTRRDDSPRRQYLASRLAAVAKEASVRAARYSTRSATLAWRSGPAGVE